MDFIRFSTLNISKLIFTNCPIPVIMDTLFSECWISQKFSILKISSKSLLQSVRDDTAPQRCWGDTNFSKINCCSDVSIDFLYVADLPFSGLVPPFRPILNYFIFVWLGWSGEKPVSSKFRFFKWRISKDGRPGLKRWANLGVFFVFVRAKTSLTKFKFCWPKSSRINT